MAEKQPVPKDPIQTRSLSLPIFIASALMMVSVVLAGYDEFFGRRAYKQYQRGFVAAYLNYLDDLEPKQQAKFDALVEEPEYKALLEAKEAADAKVAAEEGPLKDELAEIQGNVDILQALNKSPKSLISSLRYKLETARSDERRDNIRTEIEQVQKEKRPVTLKENRNDVALELNFGEAEARLMEFSARKTELEGARARLTQDSSTLNKQLIAYVNKNLGGPTPDAIEKLIAKAKSGQLGNEGKSIDDILQIHIGEMDWVDRCESCHAGTREPVDMSAEDILATTNEGVSEDNVHVYTSHPTKELLEIHNPERFGCSMCHGGNGRSVTSVHLAHGLNHHWLFPLHPRENVEAGCVQCHTDDLKLDHADTLNEGRWLFFWRGCWGCHKYEGYDTQFEEIQNTKNEIMALNDKRERMLIERDILKEQSEKAVLNMEVSQIETRLGELTSLSGALEMERQKPGPSLYNVGAKIKRDWILPWLLEPTTFRPTTKMPSFFENLDPETARDHATKIAAYLWQTAPDVEVPARVPGNADSVARGQAIFDKRGCLGCHSIERNGETIGDGFAADLSHVGEKVNHDFLVKWILQPDSGVMPNLRLTVEEASDVATFLSNRKTDRVYDQVPQLSNPKLKDEGLTLIRHYGCAGCHVITGLEDEGRIGTELTYEGSKPKERLDFGRLEHNFKRAHKYTHKAFFEAKLRKPGIFGRGKEYANDLERLKMPNFRLDESQVTALTTLIKGSIESEVPETFMYNPDERRKAIQKGWWVVRKYNCIGCHQFEAGVEPALWSLPQYTGEDENGKRSDRRPPSVVGQGFRSNPEWLAAFLRNPPLNDDDIHGNGVRRYLDVRMPTFRLSGREIQTLVRFFGALESQPVPFIAPKITPLNEAELIGTREYFKLVGCFKCHDTGDATREGITAPDLTVGRDKLKYEWLIRWFTSPKMMMPGTGMPEAFVPEHRVRLKDGVEHIGTGFRVSRRGEGQITIDDGTTIKFAGDQVVESEMIRMVGNPVPDELKALPGRPDHRDLMARYLLLHFDANEAQITLPKE